MLMQHKLEDINLIVEDGEQENLTEYHLHTLKVCMRVTNTSNCTFTFGCWMGLQTLDQVAIMDHGRCCFDFHNQCGDAQFMW